VRPAGDRGALEGAARRVAGPRLRVLGSAQAAHKPAPGLPAAENPQ